MDCLSILELHWSSKNKIAKAFVSVVWYGHIHASAILKPDRVFMGCVIARVWPPKYISTDLCIRKSVKGELEFPPRSHISIKDEDLKRNQQIETGFLLRLQDNMSV